MSSGPRRGALVGGLVAVLAIAIGVWLMTSERGGESGATPGGTAGSATPAPAEPPGFKSTEASQPKSLQPQGDTMATPPGTARKGSKPAPAEPPVVAQGHVIWTAGKLPDDVDVSLYDADGTALDSTTTETDGSYALRWDDPLPNGWSVGTDSITAAFNGESVDLAPDNTGALPAHLSTEPPIVADLLVGLPPTITGSVHDRATGAALGGAEVSAVSIFQAWSMDGIDVMTDDSGNFSIPLEDLPLRGLMVWARADGYLGQLNGPQDVAPAAKPGESMHVDFALEKAAAWHGKVISALSGAPVEGATVTVGSDYCALVGSADFEITDENGEFSLELPEMPAQGAWVHAYVDDGTLSPVVDRDVAPGKDLILRMQPTVTLGGKVLIGDKPVAAASVEVYFDGEAYYGDNGLYDEGRTDPSGVFSIPLEYAPPGNAKLKIEVMGCAPYEAKLSDVARPGKGGDLEVTVQLVTAP